MKKSVFFLLLMCSSLSILATNAPTMLIISTTSSEVQVPIASIQKITYNEAGTTMYVYTNSGTNSYEVATITRMALNNGNEPTALNQLPDSKSKIENSKFTKDGVVYVMKEGKIYTMKGEKL